MGPNVIRPALGAALVALPTSKPARRKPLAKIGLTSIDPGRVLSLFRCQADASFGGSKTLTTEKTEDHGVSQEVLIR